MSNSKWSLFKEKGVWVVRRWEQGKYRRMPLSKYRHLRDSDEEMRKFILRENAPFTAKQAVSFKHAFIDDALIEEYRQQRVAEVPREKNALCEVNYLVKYALNFFVGELGLSDPRRWYSIQRSKWSHFLLKEELSVSTLRKVVQGLNRFMEFLATKYPTEFVAIKFEPISRPKFNSLAARQRQLKGRDRYIKPDRWEKIEKVLPARIKSAVSLCYYFGLRRSEALGLQLVDVRTDCLRIERQQLILGKTDILKGKKSRKVPYWYSSPAEAYKLIENIVPLSPDTLADEWSKLKTGFNLHDLRATFITRAFKDGHKSKEIQLAVGHKHSATTDLYSQDYRDFGDDIWTPDMA